MLEQVWAVVITRALILGDKRTMNAVHLTRIMSVSLFAISLPLFAQNEAKQATPSLPLPPLSPAFPVFNKTFLSLNSQMQGWPTATNMPRKTHPAYLAFANELARISTILGTADLPVSGLDSFEGLCGPPNVISVTYSMAGLSLKAGPSTPKDKIPTIMQQVMQANAVLYFDEIFPVMLFSYQCLANHVPVLEKFFATLPAADLTEIRKNGARGMGRNLANMVTGLLQTAASPTLDMARRRATLSRITQDAEKATLSFSLTNRLQLKTQALMTKAALPLALQPYIVRLVAILDTAPCGLLCKV
jgi:hypothetical protein